MLTVTALFLAEYEYANRYFVLWMRINPISNICLICFVSITILLMYLFKWNISYILGKWGKSEISYSVDRDLGKSTCRKCMIMFIHGYSSMVYQILREKCSNTECFLVSIWTYFTQWKLSLHSSTHVLTNLISVKSDWERYQKTALTVIIFFLAPLYPSRT